jgi:HK97 family phage major capsid protein
VIGQLLQLVLTVAAGDSVSPPLWLVGGSLAPGAPMSLLGRPLFVSEHIPNLGSAGDIAFLDFGHYLIGDRQAMTSEASIHYKFQNDQTAYRVIERVDGRPWLATAITPENGGPTLSPVVKLAA